MSDRLPIVLPDSTRRPDRRDKTIFKEICRLAASHWTELYPNSDSYECSGIVEWRPGPLEAELTCTPGDCSLSLLLRANIADRPRKPFILFPELMFRANAAFDSAKIVPDFENGILRVKAKTTCFAHKEARRFAVNLLFQDFIGLVHDDALRAVLEVCEARLLSLPTNLFDDDV